jgi:MipA family protein
MRTRHSIMGFAALAALAACEPALAGLREILLAFDLNEYAIGGNASTSEDVYVGASGSVTYYPVIMEQFPAAFDDGLVFTRDGAYGLRWAPPSGWELGALVRVQTLGFVEGDSAALAGMPDRPWTLEAGPSLGWRGWPVDVDWTVFFDTFRHQPGSSQSLRLSLPWRRDRVYLIPELAWRRYSDSFVDYYFGVPDSAATAARPAYSGEATDGWSAAISWGVRISSAWLVSGRLGVERFGSGIAASPLVAADERLFASVQVAYDRPLFKRDDDSVQARVPSAEVRASFADVAGDTWFATVQPLAAAGEPQEQEDTLGYLAATVHVAQRQRIDASFFDALHDSALQDGTRAALRALYLGYSFAVLDDAQKELNVGAGLHASRVEVTLPDPAQSFERSSRAPMPAVAATAEARFARKLVAHAEAAWFLLDYDGDSGRRLLLVAGLEHRTFRRVGLGIGYLFNRVSLEMDDAAGGRVDFDYRGPVLSVTGYF